VVLVTGASSGIGAAAAGILAARGAQVLLHGREPARLSAVAAATGGAALTADLSQAAEVDRLAGQALAVAGRVDVLVANAGAGWYGPFDRITGEDLECLIAVNLTAHLRLTRLLLPQMRLRGGYLAYVSSIAGRTGVPGEAAYSAAKAGLDAFAESLRLELRGTGVGVGVLVPAVVDTPFFQRRGRPYYRNWPRPLPVEPVAVALVDMIEAERPEAYRPRWLRLAVTVRATIPSMYRALAARFDDPHEWDR
jgi:short-subunit dehydrogenase